MTRTILLIFALIIQGCAHISEKSSLYSEFMEYRESVEGSTLLENYTKYFDPALTSDIDLTDSSTVSQLEFSKMMAEEVQYFELVSKTKGCLTVNGKGVESNPIAFYIEYKYINEKWLIADIDVSFLENPEDYAKKALCPSEIRIN